MPLGLSDNAFSWVLGFLCVEAVFLGLFTLVILCAAGRATTKLSVGMAALCAATVLMESIVVPLCVGFKRPHWAATVASLLWVQFLSASELILVSRVQPDQLSGPYEGRLRVIS